MSTPIAGRTTSGDFVHVAVNEAGGVQVAATTAIPTTDSLGGTRAFNWAAGTRVAFSTSSTGALPLPTLGASRELQVLPDARCFIRFGDSGVAAATVAEGQMIGIPDLPNVIRVPVGQTHYRVIGQSSSGNLSLTPVL